MIAAQRRRSGGHEKKGRALILLDKNEEGLDELRKAVAPRPERAATYHLSLGNALNKLGKVDEAALEFRAAMKSAPDDADAPRLLGMALRDAGRARRGEAASSTRRSSSIRSNGRAYFELGLLYNAEKKQADAEIALSKAVQLSPNESLFWYAYGEIFRLQERFDDAITAYKKAVDLDPPYPKALTKLGLLLVERKQYDDAEIVLTQAIRREPQERRELPRRSAWSTRRSKSRSRRSRTTRSSSSSRRRTIPIALA